MTGSERPAQYSGDVSGTHPSGDSVRRRNLSRLLRLVHREGPLSRAALTEATALNRSTIADLVGELVRAGLVLEGAPAAAGRVGRPSPVVSAA
ncbi:MAG: transcriptional regulator/sugar kinase, partial [Microbacterium sp.]|nr:transcriptional regulator/sugar kinase [Microbacterium sp.]